MFLSIILVAAVCGIIILLGVSFYNAGHFSRNGVKSTPSWPLIGDMLGVLFRTEHFRDFITRHYTSFAGQRYIGVDMFGSRMIMIKDLELIKQVTVKDFDHFTDHFAGINESVDTLFGSNLFSMTGQKWRDMRATLSPAFTSSKMRNMYQFIADCGEQTAQFYLNEMKNPQNESKGHIEVEIKDTFSRYANDVIASTAFGIKVDSLSERENIFYEMGKSATNFRGIRSFKFILFTMAPRFSKMTGMKIFSEDVSNFFRNLVSDSIKGREDGRFSRPDMIQLLMEAKRGSLKHEKDSDEKENADKEAGFATVEESSVGKETVKRNWTDDQIVAQAILFFIAGFETSSTILSFLAHELATNPDIQEKLQEEIDEVALRNNGKLLYSDVQKMKYMDMVVSETLRLWPPVVTNDRKCVKAYTLPPPCDSPGHKGYSLAVGDGVWIPAYAIHRDPNYFPQPNKFIPERFSNENKGSIQPFTYMPFGLGPRNCIGSRFALMEVKSVIFHMLAKFDFVVISKTQIPLKIANNTFNLAADKGFWLGLKPRVHASN